MSVALQFYERMIDAGEDKVRAKVMAEALEALEERYPQLKDIATQGHVRESELRLQKEIKEVEGRLQKEIELVRLEIREVDGRLQKEIREVEGRLQKEIELVRLEIKNVDVRLRETEIRLTQAIHRQTLWVIGSVGAVVGLIRFLDWMLVHLS